MNQNCEDMPLDIENILEQIFQNLELRSALEDVLKSFLGVFAAFILTAFIYKNSKNKDADKIKKHTLSSLIEETSGIKTVLEDPNFKRISWDPKTKHFVGSWILMEKDSYESSIKSGNFTLLSPALQNTISRLYLMIKNNNFLYFQVTKFPSFNIFLSNAVDEIAEKLTNDMNDNIHQLRIEIEKVIPRLETAKKYSRYI